MTLTVDAPAEPAAKAEAYPSPVPLTPAEKQQLFRLNAVRACVLSTAFTRDAIRQLSLKEAAEVMPALLELLSGSMMMADLLRQKLLGLSEDDREHPFFNFYYDEVLSQLTAPQRTN